MFFSLKFLKDDHFERVDVEVVNYDKLLELSIEILSCTFMEL